MKLADEDSPIAECACWRCGYIFNAATCVNKTAKPKPGDTSICVQCGEIGVYNKKLQVTKPTAAQLQKFEADPEIREAQAEVRLAALIFSHHRMGHA